MTTEVKESEEAEKCMHGFMSAAARFHFMEQNMTSAPRPDNPATATPEHNCSDKQGVNASVSI